MSEARYRLKHFDFGRLNGKLLAADRRALEVAVSSLENAKRAVELVDGTADIARTIDSVIANVHKTRLELGSRKNDGSS